MTNNPLFTYAAAMEAELAAAATEDDPMDIAYDDTRPIVNTMLKLAYYLPSKP